MQKIRPSAAIAKDFQSDWYKKWAAKLHSPAGRHAKFWEEGALLETMSSRGLLKPGKKGLGMGVGQEKLPSLIASYGVEVVATDQDPESDQAKQWDNGQLSKGTDSLFYKDIIDKKKFNDLVTYRSYDMNVYEPAFSKQFDFIWHNCVIGHLGSMRRSIKHLATSAKYLKPGGYLIFTTEINIGSLNKNIDEDSDTITWRLSDLERLQGELMDHGLISENTIFSYGDSPEDLKIEYHPLGDPDSRNESKEISQPDFFETKITFSNHAIMQVLLVFKKHNIGPLQKLLRTNLYFLSRHINQRKLLSHSKKNPDLRDYHSPATINSADVERLNQEVLKFKAKKGQELSIDVKFKNNSSSNLYEYGPIFPYSAHPLVVSTAKPINHTDSKVYSESWFSKNRPAVAFSQVESLDGNIKNKEFHKAAPGEIFSFKFKVKAPNKKGKVSEEFCLTQEGIVDFYETTKFKVELDVS